LWRIVADDGRASRARGGQGTGQFPGQAAGERRVERCAPDRALGQRDRGVLAFMQ